MRFSMRFVFPTRFGAYFERGNGVKFGKDFQEHKGRSIDHEDDFIFFPRMLTIRRKRADKIPVWIVDRLLFGPVCDKFDPGIRALAEQVSSPEVYVVS
jgi:hypothetical protein